MRKEPRQSIAPVDAARDQRRCGLCGKTEKLTRTPCCGNWICDDENQYVPFSYERSSCFRNHTMFTVCGFHHQQGHKGRWQDCAQCREDGPLELYVHHATNEYNFEKLPNPPPFEPTHCHRCSVRVRLAHDSYSMDRDGVLCMACGESKNPSQREGFSRALGRQHSSAQRSEADYPIGTLAYYGPTNRLATKIATSIVKRPGADPDRLHRGITHAGDIRDDQAIAQQVSAFFRRHRVKEVASSRRVIGCPHEEWKDYPAGGKCPHCPFWHDRDRFTLDPLLEDGMSASEIVADLSEAKPKRQPIEALVAAECHRQELVEPLLRAIERGLADPDETPPGEAMLFSFAVYLLAKWREARAYRLFIRWLSLPGEGAFDIGGDTVTQDGKRLLASVCGGDLAPIKRLILNREANEFCRGQGVEALALLAARQEVPHREVTEYFTWLAREGLERVHSHVWDNLAASCADTEALDVFPELRRAYAEGLIDAGFMNVDNLDKVEQCPRGQRLAHFRELHPPIDDVATETAWWQCFRNDPFQAMAREASTERERSLLKPRPFRASPKVGRNDPCPCGSGKKFKNCCGK